MYFPGLDAAVITQSNNSLFAGTIASAVADAFFGAHMTEAPARSADSAAEEAEGAAVAEGAGPDFDPATFDPASFDPMVGRYELEDAPGFVLTFTREGEKLFLQATGQPKVDIVPTSPTTFKLTVVAAAVTFHTGEDGKVASLTLHQNGDHPAKRLAEAVWAPTGDELAAYTGRYFSAELECFYHLIVEDGALKLQVARYDDLTLAPAKRHSFTGGYPVAEIAFQTDEAGAVVGFAVSNGRTRDVRFVRMD
jgi:hypothetical protein